jgi:uncharacterized membrane protein YsdA (DUF1294 family)
LVIIFLLCLLSVITFVLFGTDKRKALKHKWRISERTLLFFSVFGGIGGLLGMFVFHHKTRKLRFKILVPIFAFVDAAVLAFFLYASVYYAADASAADAMQSDSVVAVEKTDTGWLFDGPADEKVLIFYPGAKVDETAYAPLLHRLAEEEMDVYLVKMPLNLAFFGIGRAGEIVEDSAYEQYYISGHSLGGAMAAYYAAEHVSDFKGMILFAAYPTQETAIDTLVIYGSEDGVLNMARIAEAPKLVSGNYSEVVIDGGNHAQFGNYGKQKGDGEADISAEEQQTQTIQAIRKFVNDDSSDRLF